MASDAPIVGIIMGSRSDWETMRHAADTLVRLDVPHEVKVVHRLPLDLQLDEKGIAREHFGFADGISQPVPYDEGGALVLSTGGPAPRDTWNGVPLGEILFGYTNGHHEQAPGPFVPESAAGSGWTHLE